MHLNQEKKDAFFMQRCLDLAKKGRATAAPNPMVGSVVVHKDVIIGEGWHHAAGQPHAEVNAIENVQNKALLKEATLYVNLEPCNHYGRTPPCALLLVEHQLKRVVIGCQDPFEKVNGSGIQRLKENGIEVTVGVLEEEAQALNQRFFTYHKKKRPYVILKWAQSNDGFLAPFPQTKKEKAPFFLTPKKELYRVHQWRSEEMAIAVGAQTVEDDNPQLTTRWVEGKHPVRVVFDPKARIDQKSHLLSDGNTTIHLTNALLGLENPSSTVFLERSLHYLYEKEILSILIEGGAKTLQGFIDTKVWDEARIYVSEAELQEGIKAPNFSDLNPSKKIIGWHYLQPR